MDEQLRNLKAYTRSEEKEARTLHEIQRLVRVQKNKERIKLVSTYVSAAALLFILIASFITNPSTTLTTAAGEKELKAAEMLVDEPSPWYNLNRMRLNDESVALLSTYVKRLETEDISPSVEWTGYYSHFSYLGIFKDGTYQKFIFFHSQNEQYETVYFANPETGNTIAISRNEYEKTFEAFQVKKDKPLWEILLQLVGLIILFTIYLAAVKRINPHLRTSYFYAPSFVKFLKYFILFCLYIWGINVFSQIFSGFQNLLLAWILIIIAAIFRASAENYRGDYHRSWWEVPVTIIVYCVGFCIMYV